MERAFQTASQNSQLQPLEMEIVRSDGDLRRREKPNLLLGPVYLEQGEGKPGMVTLDPERGFALQLQRLIIRTSLSGQTYGQCRKVARGGEAALPKGDVGGGQVARGQRRVHSQGSEKVIGLGRQFGLLHLQAGVGRRAEAQSIKLCVRLQCLLAILRQEFGVEPETPCRLHSCQCGDGIETRNFSVDAAAARLPVKRPLKMTCDTGCLPKVEAEGLQEQRLVGQGKDRIRAERPIASLRTL